MATTVKVGDVGTSIDITVKDQDGVAVDLSASTGLTMVFVKPDDTQTRITRTATMPNGGADGLVRYVTVNGDIDIAGTWQLQVVVTTTVGQWHSDIYKLKVGRSL